MNIHDLPTELLANIFIYHVHGRSKALQATQGRASSKLRRVSAHLSSRTHDSVDLTHVCRLWRTIAISMPQIWATICAHQPEFEEDVKMFELWLQRSAGPSGIYPLTLTIIQKRAASDQFLGQIISLAIAQHQRWKSIHLELYKGSHVFFSPLHTMAPLSLLQEFKLRFGSWNTGATHRVTTILCSSPALRSVDFGAEFFSIARAELLMDIVPWDRQTRVGFIFLHPCIFVRILSSSTDALHQISVTTIGRAPRRGAEPIPHVTTRSLRSINIGSFSESHFSHTFDNLTLPSLQELHLPGGLGAGAGGWEPLLKLLERSECKLQVFVIGGYYDRELITEHLESPLFEHLTTLKVLSGSITRLEVPLQLLDALSEVWPGTRWPRLFPLLEVLELDSVRSVDRVREMVSARVAAYGGCGRSKLRRVSAQRKDGGFVLDITSPKH